MSLKLLLKENYGLIILSILSYILFRIINRIKYKKKINLKEELVLILFIIYLLILFSIVTYPNGDYGKNNYNIFNEIFRYQIGSKLFIKNIIGNIIIFIPFGMFIFIYFHIKVFYLIIIAILFSLSIELTQILINRVFDIDDIILNLVGAIIGYYFSKYT